MALHARAHEWVAPGGGILTDSRYADAVSDDSTCQFAVELARFADENKAEDVVVLDLRGLSQVTDLVVICTGTSDRQMRAVVDGGVEYGSKVGEKPYGLCGYENAAWILVDFVDVVFHIFDRSHRSYYDLELLWGDAPRIEWAPSRSA